MHSPCDPLQNKSDPQRPSTGSGLCVTAAVVHVAGVGGGHINNTLAVNHLMSLSTRLCRENSAWWRQRLSVEPKSKQQGYGSYRWRVTPLKNKKKNHLQVPTDCFHQERFIFAFRTWSWGENADSKNYGRFIYINYMTTVKRAQKDYVSYLTRLFFLTCDIKHALFFPI